MGNGVSVLGLGESLGSVAGRFQVVVLGLLVHSTPKSKPLIRFGERHRQHGLTPAQPSLCEIPG